MNQNRSSTHRGHPINEVVASTIFGRGHVGILPRVPPVGRRRRRRRRRSVIGPIVATVLIAVAAAMS